MQKRDETRDKILRRFNERTTNARERARRAFDRSMVLTARNCARKDQGMH